ncbi:expansin EXLX1 family cellulose-binding protein [Kitasatospora azatica]|uniref:expansin EXLX1 family cellulose-binding protein n=1 Tax=Kitasatospora azatica TaxID=58347 RepID=UPI000565F9BE|nr:expansin EXLX1 family cellulose-binding protein [Kitasatospora azatica]
MKATRHAAQQPWRRRALIAGIPLALLAIGVLVFLTLGPGSGNSAEAGRVVDAPASAAVTSLPPVSGSAAATGTSASGQPSASSSASASASSASSSPAGSASPSRSGKASATPSATASATPSTTASATRAATAVAPSAGRIKPGVSYPGVATAYDAADGNGACSFGPTGGDMMVAAMNFTDYEVSRACGAYVQIHASNGASLTVRIVNVCPLPCAVGQLDLSQQAFAKLADLSVGRLAITWTLLSPESVGPLSVRYKPGSSKWWCGIQAIGHRNPIATLEVQAGGSWRQLPRTDYNYFLSADGTGCGGSIRITDIYGEQLTVDNTSVQPDVVQSTSVQFARH